jgi:hypothetical protein
MAERKTCGELASKALDISPEIPKDGREEP